MASQVISNLFLLFVSINKVQGLEPAITVFYLVPGQKPAVMGGYEPAVIAESGIVLSYLVPPLVVLLLSGKKEMPLGAPRGSARVPHTICEP